MLCFPSSKFFLKSLLPCRYNVYVRRTRCSDIITKLMQKRGDPQKWWFTKEVSIIRYDLISLGQVDKGEKAHNEWPRTYQNDRFNELKLPDQVHSNSDINYTVIRHHVKNVNGSISEKVKKVVKSE